MTAKPAKSQIEARSELAAEIRKQADDFDKELAKFLAGGDIVKKEIESLGTNKFRLDHNAVCLLMIYLLICKSLYTLLLFTE